MSSIFDGTGTGSDVSQSGQGQVSSERRENGTTDSNGAKGLADYGESFDLGFGEPPFSPGPIFEAEGGTMKGPVAADGKDRDPSDCSDIDHSDIAKIAVPEPLLSEISDSEGHAKTPRSSSSAKRSSKQRKVTSKSKLSDSESSSDDERPAKPAVVRTERSAPTVQQQEAAPVRRGRGRPKKEQSSTAKAEKVKRPARPPKGAAPISREIIESSSSSSSSSASSDSEVDVLNTPSPNKQRKPSLTATVTPPTTPRKQAAAATSSSAPVQPSPSKLSLPAKSASPSTSRVLFPRQPARTRSSSESSDGASLERRPVTSGRGKGQPRPREEERDRDLSEYSPPKLDTDARISAPVDRNKSVTIMKVFGFGGSAGAKGRGQAVKGKQQPKKVEEVDESAPKASATPSKTSTAVAPPIAYVNGRPSVVCQVPLSKLIRQPERLALTAAAASNSVDTKVLPPVASVKEVAKCNRTRRPSIGSNSSSTPVTLSKTTVPSSDTPSHRKESKRKRRSDVDEEKGVETDKKKKKKSRRKSKGVDDTAPPPNVATPTHLSTNGVQSHAFALPPSHPSPSSSSAVRVFYSYFEDVPIAAHLDHEDRDQNHYLSEAKALKHAADRQVGLD